jgi:hypothetical protein
MRYWARAEGGGIRSTASRRRAPLAVPPIAAKNAGSSKSKQRSWSRGEHPVEVAVVPVEAGVDRVGAALHAGPPLDAERLVLRDRVDAGLEAPDVLPHLEQELALREPGHGGVVSSHETRRRRGRTRGRNRQGCPGAGVDRTSAPS